MIFRIRYRTQGRYTHCRLFSGETPTTLHEVGKLTFRNNEFEAFRGEFRSVSSVDFLPEDWELAKSLRPIENPL